MKTYMITGALGAALIALSACGNPSEVDFTEDGTMVEGSAEENAVIDEPDYADATPGYESTDPAASTQSADMADMDEAQNFVDMASQANLAEIRTSEVAVERASTPEVKEYAQMIIDDHTAAGNALKTAMSGAMLTPPSMVLDQDHQRRLDDITVEEQGSTADPETAGNEWDHDYIAMQIDMHQDAIDLFEDYAENGENASLKTFAESTLPTLRSHLDKAREIEGMVDDNNIVTPD